MSLEIDCPYFLSQNCLWKKYVKCVDSLEKFEQFHDKLWESHVYGEISLSNYWYLLKLFTVDVLKYHHDIKVVCYRSMIDKVLLRIDAKITECDDILTNITVISDNLVDNGYQF